MAAVRRWARSLEERELRGRVVAVPVLNLPAFRARTPFVVPDDGKNLNRCFPGDPAGTLADRLAYDAFTQLISGSDALVDAHTGDMVEALEPFALYDAGPAEARARELASAYGLGYVIRQEPGPDRARRRFHQRGRGRGWHPRDHRRGGRVRPGRAGRRRRARPRARPHPRRARHDRPPAGRVRPGSRARLPPAFPVAALRGREAGGSRPSARAKPWPRGSCSAPSAASTAPASCRRSRPLQPACRCSSPVPPLSPPTASSSASAPPSHPARARRARAIRPWPVSPRPARLPRPTRPAPPPPTRRPAPASPTRPRRCSPAHGPLPRSLQPQPAHQHQRGARGNHHNVTS